MTEQEGAAGTARILAAAREAVEALRRRGWRLAIAESCTGGLVAHLVTEVPGASACFELGVVTYADRAKRDVLGVPEDVLATHGAVSRETVECMARGVRARPGAEIGLALSGIAGPTGGTPDKPVGTVHLALATPEGTRWQERRFEGDRSGVKRGAAHAALEMVRRYCGQKA